MLCAASACGAHALCDVRCCVSWCYALRTVLPMHPGAAHCVICFVLPVHPHLLAMPVPPALWGGGGCVAVGAGLRASPAPDAQLRCCQKYPAAPGCSRLLGGGSSVAVGRGGHTLCVRRGVGPTCVPVRAPAEPAVAAPTCGPAVGACGHRPSPPRPRRERTRSQLLGPMRQHLLARSPSL